MRVFFLSLLLVFASCARNPVTGKNEIRVISEKAEVTMGETHYPSMQQLQGGLYLVDPDLQVYVNKVGQKLARLSDRPNLPYEFVVLNDSTLNAWALPGGKIAIYRGLLFELKNEAELAAVLAHEIVHVAAGHTAQRMQQDLVLEGAITGLDLVLETSEFRGLAVDTASVFSNLLSSGYSRSQELQADHYGMVYMKRAGYDPTAAVSLQKMFFDKFQDTKSFESLFASHPPSLERIEANKKTIDAFIEEDPVFEGSFGKEPFERALFYLVQKKPAYEFYDKASLAFEKGQYHDAEAYLEKAFFYEPKEAHFYALQAKIFKAQRKYSQALRSYAHAIDLNAKYFDFYLQRGLIFKEMKDYEAAKSDLQKSLLFLKTAQAHKALGELSLLSRKKEAAILHFREASQSDSEIGRAALREYGRLVFERRPQELVALRFLVDENQLLFLELVNQSALQIDQVSLRVNLPESVWGLKERLITITEPIGSGKSIVFPTRLGPVEDFKKIQHQLKYKILRVQSS